MMGVASLMDIPSFLEAYPPLFYLSLLVIVTSFLGSLYFFVEWLYHGRRQRLALCWSLGLLSAYLFQVPVIFANQGLRFFLGDFNLFFSVAFTAAFIGNLLIYIGVLIATRSDIRKSYVYLSLPLFLSVFLSSYFVWGGSVLGSYVPLINTIVLFLPVFVIIMIKLGRWYNDAAIFKTKVGRWGVGILITAFCIKILQALFMLFRFFSLPSSFWFLAIADSPVVFFSQILTTLMLLVGFLFVHKDNLAVSSETQKTS